MAEPSLVTVSGLTRYFGPLRAVHELNFSVARGEVLGFLGPNGAGKSTTMQMLTGNLAPSQGQVTIHGVDILDHPRQAKAEIGYLPEQPPVYRELTVDEYLAFCARLHRLPRAHVAAARDRAKERCGLTQVGRRLIGQLSKGFQQRVGIAQAIIHEPALVILDEPTVGLDPIQIREIRSLIRELGTTHGVILSTHILPEVQATCNRVQIIHRGELVLTDTIAGLQTRMQSSSVVVRLRAEPPTEALASLAGVLRVEAMGGGRYRVHHAPTDALAEQLAARCVEQGWGLMELTPERRTLEEIFVDITTHETTEQEAAA